MHGSPTLLIDGMDPFTQLGQPPGMSCRLYRDEDGRISGSPSVGQLRRAIEQARDTALDRRDHLSARPEPAPGASPQAPRACRWTG